jgi:hypothetical protein
MKGEKMVYIGDFCVVCLDNSKGVNTALQPCMHQYMCDECTKLVVDANMKCPLCRSAIEGTKYNPTHFTKAADVDAEQEFMEKWRAQYLDDLYKVRSAKGATGWKGNNKLAASIKEGISNAMEEAAAMSQGTERMISASKSSSHEITVKERSRYFEVNYKKHCYFYHYLPLDELKEMVIDMEPMTEHELASWMPQVFWLLVYHVGASHIENTMNEWGILQKGRRRKRARK